MQNIEEFKENDKLNELKSNNLMKSQTIIFNEELEPKAAEEEKIIIKNTKGFCKYIENTLRKALLSSFFSFFATFAIVVILFIDDLRIIGLHKKWDELVDVIMIIIIIFIFIEISLFFIVIRSYKYTFFFWLDICSFCSLIPDLLIIFVHDENQEYANLGSQSK